MVSRALLASLFFLIGQIAVAQDSGSDVWPPAMTGRCEQVEMDMGAEATPSFAIQTFCGLGSLAVSGWCRVTDEETGSHYVGASGFLSQTLGSGTYYGWRCAPPGEGRRAMLFVTCCELE